jgi:hypothetical protein
MGMVILLIVMALMVVAGVYRWGYVRGWNAHGRLIVELRVRKYVGN